MEKVYNHKDVEERIYSWWEKQGYFKPEINPKGKPYCIILPPPNANGDLHFGHAMYTVGDILVRFHRMRGYQTLWLPGTDHAGIETQFVFEKKLKEEGKSRFDYTGEQLYRMIWEYVAKNRGGIEHQLRRLGFSLDWSREKFTLDSQIVTLIEQTFISMYHDGLVYRDYRLVNYCTKDGTSFSDLEVVYEEKKDPLYYIKYGPLVLATTRPETKFGDTAVAVHPADKRYQDYIGKEIEIETVLGKAMITVVADESVDPNFGTGVVKVTPAHDFTDFEIGERHGLSLKQVIGFDGKMNEHAGHFKGLFVKQARNAVVEAMQKKGLIEKIDERYVHRVGVCYKCKSVLEPLPLEQWYVKVEKLKRQAIDAVRKKKITIYPKRFETPYFAWLENLKDWNISRQNVWGIRIPVWYEVTDGSEFTVSFITKQGKQQMGILHEVLKQGFSWDEIHNGLQHVKASIHAKVVFDKQKQEGRRYLPETDTFDTWFSSGQWPFVTLQTTKEGDFEKFYPTSVLETAYDILRAWVSRMVMLGLYRTGKVPFKHVLFHGIVNDPYGKKMSKSKGNVVNPLEVIDHYGADAVRFALMYENATGNDQSLSYPKLEAARKFTNKLWNIGRFIEMNRIKNHEVRIMNYEWNQLRLLATIAFDKEMIDKTEELVKSVTELLVRYDFNHASQALYEFVWHVFADTYIEDVKNRMNPKSFMLLHSLFVILLKLLHPFLPFVTEEIYQKLIPSSAEVPVLSSVEGTPRQGESLMIAKWPQNS